MLVRPCPGRLTLPDLGVVVTTIALDGNCDSGTLAWHEGIDLHQGVMPGIQGGVAILDIEKAHPRHVRFSPPFGITWQCVAVIPNQATDAYYQRCSYGLIPSASHFAMVPFRDYPS